LDIVGVLSYYSGFTSYENTKVLVEGFSMTGFYIETNITAKGFVGKSVLTEQVVSFGSRVSAIMTGTASKMRSGFIIK